MAFWSRVVHRIGSLCAIALIFFAVIVSFLQVSTPFLQKHRSYFENWASELLHMPVSIGEMRASWHAYWPEISFYHVALLDKNTQTPKLKIQEIDVGLNLLQSFISVKPVTSRILFSGAHIIIRYSASGNLSLDGFPEFEISSNFSNGEMKNNDISVWALSQQKIILENIDIEYYPEKKEPRIVKLKELSLANTHQYHQIDLDATLKQTTATRLRGELQWQGDVFDWKTVTADVYMNVGGFSLSQWFPEMNWHGLQIKEGLGSAKIWATWSAQTLQKIRTQLQFYDIHLHSTIANQDETISRIIGKFAWERENDNQIVSGDEVFIDFPKHLWPESQFYLVLTQGKTLSDLKIGYLDLIDATRIAMMTDFVTETAKKNLLAFNPRGALETFNGKITGDSPDLDHAIFSGKVTDFAINAVNKIPEIAHLSGDFSWANQQGDAHLNSQNLYVNLKEVFVNPIILNKAIAVMDFQKEADGTWLMHASHIAVANADVRGKAKMTLRFPVNDSPWIDLTGSFSMPRGKNVSNYLPLQTFKPTLHHWLQNAFLAGEVTSGKAILQGRLADFPFDNNQGKFYIQGVVDHIDFAYAPDWPIIKNIKGNLVFSQRSMVADVISGSMQNIPLHFIHGVIPSIGGGEQEKIDITGTIQTDFSDALRFIRESPLNKTIGRHFSGVEISGSTDLKLALSIPLEHPETVKVLGDITIANAELSLPVWKITLSPLNGVVHFTENTIEAKQLQTQLLDEPATLNIATQYANGKPVYVSAVVNSRVAIETLEKLFSFHSTLIKGTTDFSAELRMFPDKDNQLILRSELQGVSIGLPGILGKKIEDKKPIQADLIFNGNQLSSVNIRFDDKTDLKISNNKNSWKIDLNNPEFLGQITWITSARKVIAKFQKLYLQAMENGTSWNINPALLPEINFDGDDVRYQGKSLGHVIVVAVPNVARLVIRQLGMTSPLFDVRASGYWNVERTALQGSMATTHLTEMLTSWGLHSENFICSKGDMNFDLTWPGAPFDPTFNKLSGRLSLSLGEGRIVNADSAGMGIGRMLNLFNLSTLPRRLSLDFSDVFEKGYSFDHVKGDLNLRNGEAYTVNTRFDGPVASIDIAGRIGLERKDYDLTLSVTPYVTSSLWVLSAYAAGPVAGAAAFVADKLIGGAVSKATTHSYLVTGTWANPVWKEAPSR